MLQFNEPQEEELECSAEHTLHYFSAQTAAHKTSSITPQTDKVYGACADDTTKDKFNFNRKIVSEAHFKVECLKEEICNRTHEV